MVLVLVYTSYSGHLDPKEATERRQLGHFEGPGTYILHSLGLHHVGYVAPENVGPEDRSTGAPPASKHDD